MTSCFTRGMKPGLPGESGACDPPLKPNLHVVLELVHYLLSLDETQIPRQVAKMRQVNLSFYPSGQLWYCN